MRRTHRKIALLPAAGWLALAACGQTGPLYLPGNPSRVEVEDPAAGAVDDRDATEDEEDRKAGE